MNKFALSLAAVALFPAAASAQTDLGPLNLPAGSTTLPLNEDFEAAAGVVPGYMALTGIEVATLTADPEAWANIGNLGPCSNPYNGSFNLEMGLLPGSTNYHDTRQAMVIQIDPTGYTGDMTISAAIIDGGEESDTVDGIWLSNDGVNWYSILQDWGASVLPDNSWENIVPLDLTSTPVDTAVNFYVAFVQEDNFPYLDLDGIGVDEINVPGVAPPPPVPVLDVTTLTGGAYATLSVDSVYPGATTTFLASITGAGPELYNGVEVNLSSPIVSLANRNNDINGFAIFSQIVPAGLVGTTVYLQAIVNDTSGAYASTSTSAGTSLDAPIRLRFSRTAPVRASTKHAAAQGIAASTAK